jgi:hypothetical protein
MDGSHHLSRSGADLILNVHKTPSCPRWRYRSMAWYSRRPMPSLWFCLPLSFREKKYIGLSVQCTNIHCTVSVHNVQCLYSTYSRFRWCETQVTYRGRGEIGGVYLPSQLELVMVDRVKGEGVRPLPHQTRLILPSWWNVRQKVAIATLCALCEVKRGLLWKFII